MILVDLLKSMIHLESFSLKMSVKNLLQFKCKSPTEDASTEGIKKKKNELSHRVKSLEDVLL